MKDADRRLSGFFEGVRAAGRRPTMLETATAARAAALSLTDFVRLTTSHVGFGPQLPATPTAIELDSFVTGLATERCCHSVLEVGDHGAIHCATILTERPDTTLLYVTKSIELAEAIEAFGRPPAMEIKHSLADVGPPKQYDLIVVRPSLGSRPGGETTADGFGGEVVRNLLPALAPGGRLVWITGRGVHTSARAAKNREGLKGNGYRLRASIDLPAGWMPSSLIEGVALIFAAGKAERKLLGVLREAGSGAVAATALLKGMGKKPITDGLWVEMDDQRSYADAEYERSINKQMPKGRLQRVPLRTLVLEDQWEKANRPPVDRDGVGYVYIPEYSTSTVTARIEDQSVVATAVWRVAIDTSKVNPAFLVRVLNSPFGRTIRQAASGGATIPRVIKTSLMDKMVPLPDLLTQDRIVRLHADMAAVNATVADRLRTLDQDWSSLDNVSHEVEALKSVFDIDRRIDEWWRELPYPLATIYRRHRVSSDPKDRFDTILHFFEVFAVYLASIGVSHLRSLRRDAEEPLAKLFYPERATTIDRADFGFWIRLASGSLKELKRTMGDAALRAAALDSGGPSLVTSIDSIVPLWDATQLLNRPREMRNSIKGHGGLLKAADAEKANVQLEVVFRDLFATAAAALRKTILVRVGHCEILDDRNVYEAEVLQGSDPTFDRQPVASSRRVNTKSLAFWHPSEEEIIGNVPFFRLGAPKDPQESTMYVYNRVEPAGLRWVSYQEARDQEIVVPDDGLSGLVHPRR